MVVNKKPTGRALSMGAGLGVGAIFALCWTILGAMTAGKLLDMEIMKEKDIGYASVLILLTASFGSAIVSWGKIKRQRMLVCAASGGIYFLMLLCATALLFGGQYSGVWVTLILILAGSGAAMALGGHGRERKPVSKYKKMRT